MMEYYTFRVRGDSEFIPLKSENPKDAWIESRNYKTDKEIILFEKQSLSVHGDNTEMSVNYYVPIYWGWNHKDLPHVLKRSGGKKITPLELKNISNIKI